jgi:hypothetical protein
MPTPQIWFSRDMLMTDAGLVLVASSQAAGLPPSFLTDPMRRKPWRTDTGWTFGDWNGKFPFNRSGLHTATLTGHFGTPGAVCGALAAAMTAADPGNPYGVTYDVAAPDTFRVFYNSGAPLNFTIQAATGADAWRSGWQCLGFDTADRAAANSHVPTDPAYQSRHFLTITRQDNSVIGVGAAGVLEHTALLARSDTDLESKITLRAWFFSLTGAPDATAPFTDLHYGFSGSNGLWALDPCIQQVNPGSGLSMFQFQFMIDDVQNPIGYFQAGGLPLLTLTQLEKASIQRDLVNNPAEYTRILRAVDGERHTRRRRRSKVFQCTLSLMTPADRATWDAYMKDIVVGDDVYLQLDSSDPTSIVYGCFATPPAETYRSKDAQVLTFTFEEAR